MGQLPEWERRVVELVALDGLSVMEAAAAVGIRPAAARMRLTRARRALRPLLTTGVSATAPLPSTDVKVVPRRQAR